MHTLHWNISKKEQSCSVFCWLDVGSVEVFSQNFRNLLYVEMFLGVACLARWQTTTAQNMKFSIKDYFSKTDQICSKLQIWSHLLKKVLTENFIFCAVNFEALELQELAWELPNIRNFMTNSQKVNRHESLVSGCGGRAVFTFVNYAFWVYLLVLFCSLNWWDVLFCVWIEFMNW